MATAVRKFGSTAEFGGLVSLFASLSLLSVGVGTTSQSCNIRLLLSSVCWQIESVYRRSDRPTASAVHPPTDYPSLVAHFHSLLAVSNTPFTR